MQQYIDVFSRAWSLSHLELSWFTLTRMAMIKVLAFPLLNSTFTSVKMIPIKAMTQSITELLCEVFKTLHLKPYTFSFQSNTLLIIASFMVVYQLFEMVLNLNL